MLHLEESISHSYQRSIVDMGTGDSVLQKEMEQKFDKKNQTQLYFWPQAQQIGPTQVLCYIVMINNVMLVVLFVLTILGLEYGG